MSDKKNITLLTEEERIKLKNKSAFSLPDDPSQRGYNSEQIKRKLYEPTLLLFDWLKRQGLETAEIIELIRNNFNNLETKVHDRGVALELDEKNGIVKLIGKDEKGNNVVLSSIDLPFDTQINLINKYFTINEENDNVLMEYEYIINWLVVKEMADFGNGFYSNTTESGDTYSKGLSLEHNINQFSMFGYDYNYTDGTYYTNRLNFENGGNVRVAINNPNAKFTYNDKEVATEQDVEYLEKKIRNLQASAEGSTFVYEEDSNIAYQKDVPSGASPYAVVEKLGGMSYTSENLFNPYAEPIGSNYKTTIETLDDGSGIRAILGQAPTIGSTAKQFAMVKMFIPLDKFNLTKKYRFIIDKVYSSTVNGNNHRCSFMWVDKDYNSLKLLVELNGKYDGAVSLNTVRDLTTSGNYPPEGTIGMMISVYSNNQSEEAIVGSYIEYHNIFVGISDNTEFKPYFEGIRNSAVTNIVSQGQNLFNLKDEIRQIYGYNIRCLNGEMYFTGQSNGTGNIKFDFEKPLPAGTYSLSLFNTSWGSTYRNVVFGFRTSNTIDSYKYATLEYTADTYTLTTTDEVLGIFIGIGVTNLDLTGLTCYPMVVKGSTPTTEFKPYKLVNKLLPRAVTTLTDYGLGINQTYNNYIDIENKKYVRYCVPFYANGSESITLYSQNEELGFYRFRVQIIIDDTLRASNTINANLVQNSGLPNYTSYSDYANNRYEQIALQNNFIFIVISKDEASTVEEFKTWLANNPISGVYALNIPIEEDISDLLNNVDEFIEVEELGSLTFENEHSNNVSSTITYQVKI